MMPMQVSEQFMSIPQSDFAQQFALANNQQNIQLRNKSKYAAASEVRASPGGMALEDYHWSGGFYSPQFVSYDKWGQSLPEDLYGFKASVSEMIPSRVYGLMSPTSQINQYPIQVKNYELLETTSVPDIIIPEPIKLQPKYMGKTKELFGTTKSLDSVDVLIVVFLIILILYFFDKMFGTAISELNTWVKITIIAVLFLGLYSFT